MKTALCGVCAVLLLLTASCGNYVYQRISVRAPMLTEKHDVNLQLNASNAGAEVYAAYAPINYLAFSGGYTWKSDSTSIGTRVSHDIEFAAIPFYAKDILRMEMPVGYGVFQQRDQSTFEASQPYTRFFFQPTIGVSWDVGDIAFITRFTHIDYINPAYLTDNRFETGVLFRGGYKYAKLMVQVTVESGSNNSQLVDYYGLHVGFGLNIFFNGASLVNTLKGDTPKK